MPVAHKSAISFGLVHIPVELYTATQDSDVRFNKLCREDLSRVRYKMVCSGCGKEVSNKEIVKGFEYGDGEYVVVTDADFEKIKTEKDKTIRILHFTELKSIKPLYYNKAYHLAPQKGGEKAFELLRRAMLEKSRAAIAQAVLGSTDSLLCLMPLGEGLLAQTMFFEDEVKQLSKAYARPEVSEEELDMALNLVTSMDRPFEPAAYRDEYQERLRELIQSKINGKEIVRPKQEKQSEVIDLMEALKASLAGQEKEAKPPKGAAKQRGERTKKRGA
ncbi:MAG: Ku protein [Oscillospiraceae bacterium]|nr:Ku protein [Oscillospiraceae bacterium]